MPRGAWEGSFLRMLSPHSKHRHLESARVPGNARNVFSVLVQRWSGVIIVAISLIIQMQLVAAQSSPISCAVNLGVPEMKGFRAHILEVKGSGLLIGTNGSGLDGGLFFVRVADGKVKSAESVSGIDTGAVLGMKELPGGGILIGAHKGIFLARAVTGGAGPNLERLGGQTGIGRYVHSLSGLGAMVVAGGGLFLARVVDGKVSLDPLDADVGFVPYTLELPGGAIFLMAQKGDFLVRTLNGALTVDQAGNTEFGLILAQPRNLPGLGVLIGSDKGVFLVRGGQGKASVDQVKGPETGGVLEMHELPGAGVLIGARRGLFLAKASGGKATLERVDADYINSIPRMLTNPAGGVLVATHEGLFLAQAKSGRADLELVDPIQQAQMETFPGAGGVLIWNSTGIFRAQVIREKAGLELISSEGNKNDRTSRMHQIPGLGVLFYSRDSNRLLLARAADGKTSLEPVANIDSGDVETTHHLPGVGMIIHARNGLFLLSEVPLGSAIAEPLDRKAFEGILADDHFDRVLDFSIQHQCAAALGLIGFEVRVTPPGERRLTVDPKYVAIRPTAGKAEVTVRLRMPSHGAWKFQFVSMQGKAEKQIGQELEVSVRAPTTPRKLLEDSAWWVSLIVGVMLFTTNVVLFVAARRSAWAWRLATDAGMGTAILRIATVVLSHWSQAQVWILDRYFQSRRRRMERRQSVPFLPLPLTFNEEEVRASDEVLTPPLVGRRIWIQGNTGMGKTALFRHTVTAHFSNPVNSFDAFDSWGCIIAAFSARDFADGGEDKPDPVWVVDSVKATLSAEGVTFEDDNLLRRMLRTGTVAVAIDGLHEAGRTKAVEAFARAFDAAPMFVTSQEPGGDLFATWRLPFDISAFIDDLLEAYLGTDLAQHLIRRISTSGLRSQIRSGYDVRLLVDLVRRDASAATLPSDRLGLYEAVVNAAWPKSVGVPEEEQLLTSAAAWNMLSNRKPYEDQRRLRPDVDLSGDLLSLLADAPERHGRPLRLVRRVGKVFEFVHDQMHAYLAARWFTQQGFEVADMEKMLAESGIWAHAASVRRTLWGFVAALLDDKRLTVLLARVEDKEDWDALRRDLKKEAERRRLS